MMTDKALPFRFRQSKTQDLRLHFVHVCMRKFSKVFWKKEDSF